MRTNRWAWALALVVVVVGGTGCSLPGVPDIDAAQTPPAQPATVNKQAAASVAQGTIGALSATTSGGGGGAGSAGSLAAVAQSSQSLLQSSSPGTASTRSALSLVDEGVLSTLADSPGCTCTATECNFNNCSPLSGSAGSGGYTYTIDGYYSWADGHVVCRDLKYTFSGNSSNVAVTLSCDVTVTSTSIDGFVRSAGTSSADVAGQNTKYAYSASWDVTTKFEKVTFGATHQPSGGSMHVEGTTTASYAGQEQKSSGSADVSFPL